MQEDFNNRFKRHYSPHAPQRRPAPAPQHQLPQYTSAPAPKIRGKLRRHSRQFLILFVLLILIVAGGGFYYIHHKAPNPKHYFPSYITKKNYGLAAYYPVNLPAGFKVDNDFKIVQHNALFYSVSNKAGDKFNITLQPLPTQAQINSALKNKLRNPDEYLTDVGNVFVGPADRLYGSISTSNNTWILIYTTSLGSQNDMENLTRSFKQVQL